MKFIFICILLCLMVIVISDFKKRIIPNYCIASLIGLGVCYKYLKYGHLNIMKELTVLIALFSLCAAIGFIYEKKKSVDIAGGGDYKLIAVLGFLVGLKGLLICLLGEFIYEFLYRYVIFPERKNIPLPLGASLGVLAIAVIAIGGMI